MSVSQGITRMHKEYLCILLNFCLFEGYLYSVNSFSKTKFDYEITDAKTSLL